MTSDYVGTVHHSLPAEYRGQLDALTKSTVSLVDTLLRFALGGECPQNANSETRTQWTKSQTEVVEALQHYQVATNGKRFRDEDILPEEEQATKRTKLSSEDENGDNHELDAPLYTLHSISITSPLRKKVDLVIGQRSLRFVDIKTGQEEKKVPLSVFKRAFLLPTRGKSKPHWTVILLASDVPVPTGKKAAAAAASSGKDYTQVIFGVDASPSAPFVTTDYKTSPASPITHPKDSPITPALYAFLSHLPIPLVEPATSVFRSALVPGESSAGVQAYRHAKEGTLWFLDGGVLWDRTPCEYWPLVDLVSGDTSEGGMGTDGVRIVSATGRTCSVFFRRRVRTEKRESDMDTGGDAEQEEDFVETDVENIDGKEQDGIARWVKKRKHLFGQDVAKKTIAESTGAGRMDKGKGKAVAVTADDEDTSDEDDSDFVADSEDDGGSATSDSEGEDDGAGDNEDAEGEDDVDEDEDEDEESEGEELDPARHPLLRAGAMPRISKGAIEAAVSMVTEDFLEISTGDVKSRGKGKGKGKVQDEESDPEDEEDELDD